jgi:hypothetical protein
MNINDLKTIEQLEQFLTGTQSIAFLVASNKKDIYRDIQRTLVKFRYAALNCQSALKSIHLTASNNVQQISKVIPFLAPFYAA